MFIPKYGKTKKAVVTTPGPPKTTPHPVPTETGLIIAVTGHRPEKLGGYGDNPIRQNVRAEISKILDEMQPKAVVTGMALGVDQWVAEICIMKDIPFVAAIPCIEHESRWPPSSKLHYQALLTKAAEKIIVTNTPYADGVMKVRNQWMVDRCHVLLAVYDGTDGGTGHCVRYAQKIGRPIRFVEIDKTSTTVPFGNDLKKPSELIPESAQLQMEFMKLMGLPIPKIAKPLPPDKTKVIVAGTDGELFSKETKDSSPYERLVDLD